MAYTAAQIVAEALAIAKCPGFTAQGGRALNFVLDDLVLHRNLKVNLIASSIAITPNSKGPFNLEAKYLRTYDLFYMLNGQPQKLNPTALVDFDQDSNVTQSPGYPYEYATDLSAVPTLGFGLLYVYPASSSPVTLTHRYYTEQTPIAAPESSSATPWFSDQDYLVHATAMRMMRITDDARYDKFVMDCDRLLEIHLLTEGDEQQVVKEVKLDPRRFRLGRSSRPTKDSPF